MQLLDTTASIETPERVRFRYRLAGPGPRALAWAFDMVLRFCVLAALGWVLTVASALPVLGDVGVGLFLALMFLLDWFYGMLFEAVFAGQTPGKMAMQIRVVRLDGAPVQLPDVVLRNLLRAADFLPVMFGLGVLIMLWDRRLRRLGDLVGGTVVVIEERASVLGRVQLVPPVSEEERQRLPASVPLNHEELAVIEAFLRRSPKLSPARAEELAELFAPQLSQRTGVEAPSASRVLALAYARATDQVRVEGR